MRCDDVHEALLAEHLLGGLTPPQEKDLEAHLSHCRRCASELERMRGLLGKVRRLGGRRAAPDRPERVGEIMAALERAPARRRPLPAPRASFPFWAWAATAGALVAVTLFAFKGPSEPAPVSRTAAPEPEAAPAPADPEPVPVRTAPPEPKTDPVAPLPALAPEPPPPRFEGPAPADKPPPSGAEATPQPAKAPEPRPAEPALPPEKPAPAKETVTFAATLDHVLGEVFRVSPEGSAKIKEGEGLLFGQGVETRGAQSGVRIKYPDGTHLELGPDTVIRELHDLEAKGARGKHVFLARGAIAADVVKQPPGKFMTLTTAHAESTVLGTTFRLAADAASTRLEVKEGRVRFGRLSAKSSVEVKTGQYAVAGTDVEPIAKSLFVAEIFLLAQHGHVAGGKVWQLVRDPDAAAEQAFEALRTPSRGEQIAQGLPRAPRVSFTFHADPEINYYVWMRGRAHPGDPPQDAVFVEVPGAQFVGQPQMDKDRLGGSTERAIFEGFGQHPGYVWIGGDEQDGRHDLPVRLRFSRPGLQTLTLHADETPVRIDAIWISATQGARPEDSQKGPWFHKK